MRILKPALAILAFVTVGLGARAGSFDDTKTVIAAETPFDRGKLELQSASGAFFSIGHSNEPSLNYSSTAYRLGIMLYSPAGNGWLRGNSELMLQLLGGSVFDGPGNYLGSAAAIFRYNFVQPEAKWIPYVQVGAGGLYNDVWKDHSQRLIGQPWEFDLEASLGVRYMFSSRWSASVEGGYRHISNGGSSDRNVGLNSLGATIGLSRHF